MSEKYEIKYEKFHSSIWLGSDCIKGFSCYHTEHAHKLGQEYLVKLLNQNKDEQRSNIYDN